MSKKRINIALIILVLGLWGAIGCKTINQFFFSKAQFVNDAKQNVTSNFTKIKKDTFNLETIQRDPFLNKSSIKPDDDSIVKSIYIRPPLINKPITQPRLSVSWPSVFYYGYIKSKGKTEELILVKIENNLLKLRKNSEVNGLIIKKVFNDSIEVLFNKEKRVIIIAE